MSIAPWDRGGTGRKRSPGDEVVSRRRGGEREEGAIRILATPPSPPPPVASHRQAKIQKTTQTRHGIDVFLQFGQFDLKEKTRRET